MGPRSGSQAHLHRPPSQLRTGLGCGPGLRVCRGVLGQRHQLLRSGHPGARGAHSEIFRDFPCRALPRPSGSSFYPSPISGLTLPSDPFRSPMPSSPAPMPLLGLLLTALWDHLPLEVDPCAHDHGGCSPHANCTKVAPGQRTCTCQDGYTGDGELCQGKAGVPTLHVRGARGLASVL